MASWNSAERGLGGMPIVSDTVLVDSIVLTEVRNAGKDPQFLNLTNHLLLNHH